MQTERLLVKSPARRGLLRPMVRCARGLPVRIRVECALHGRGGARVAFLPSKGREQSSLLRIYNIAAALGPLGWRAIVLLWKLSFKQRQRMLARFAPDVVVMQGVRHDLNRPQLYPEYRIVFDMDDAGFHLPHLAKLVKESMPHVAAVIGGSSYVADWCRGQGAKSHVVWTGTPVSSGERVPQAARPAVVAWAQTAPETYKSEADWVQEVMHRLVRRLPNVRLRLYDRQGDEAFLERFQAAGIEIEWRASTNYRDYLASFDDVMLGLAPLCPTTPFSRGKSFGKVLAYLDSHVPVIASVACEHGRFFNAGVVSNDMAVWVNRMEHLVSDASARSNMAAAAFDRLNKRVTFLLCTGVTLSLCGYKYLI